MKKNLKQCERELIGHALALQTHMSYLGPLPVGKGWDKFFKACSDLRRAAVMAAGRKE
ncbi:hypothetical protein LCGC14_1606810 [marine sediment metagenome]|uniref:Uncharacterized protein n=1 Tax=marine sediment metagenome TaxID=412755 RepID=A0A0F9I9V8_9ZZZZ